MRRFEVKQQIACVEREIAMRRKMYPLWVHQCKMTHQEATKEIECMEAVLRSLQRQAPSLIPPLELISTEGSLYQACLSLYNEFLLNRTGVGVDMIGRSAKTNAKALQEIIQYLNKQATDKTEAGVVKAWQFILQHWERTGDFISRQVKLTEIRKNIVEILDKIRNGANQTEQAKTHNDQLAASYQQRIRQRAQQSSEGH